MEGLITPDSCLHSFDRSIDAPTSLSQNIKGASLPAYKIITVNFALSSRWAPITTNTNYYHINDYCWPVAVSSDHRGQLTRVRSAIARSCSGALWWGTEQYDGVAAQLQHKRVYCQSCRPCHQQSDHNTNDPTNNYTSSATCDDPSDVNAFAHYSRLRSQSMKAVWSQHNKEVTNGW